MDDFLSTMYGTLENIGGLNISELEKNAEAELLFDALKSEGYDTDQIDKMSGDDVLKVAQVLFGEDSALVKAAMPGCPATCKEGCECKGDPAKCTCKGKTKEAAVVQSSAVAAPATGDETFEEKIAHADQLGRIMAHSFVDEISNIEKQAQYEQVKEAKAKQATAVLSQLNQSPAEKIAAKISGPQYDQEKVAAAMKLLKEAGVPFDQA